MTYTNSETKLSKSSRRPLDITRHNNYWRNTAANLPGRLPPGATKRYPSRKSASHPHHNHRYREQDLLRHRQQTSNDLSLMHLRQLHRQLLYLLTTCPHRKLRMANPRTFRMLLLHRHNSNPQTSLDSLQTPSRDPLNTSSNHTGTTAFWTSS